MILEGTQILVLYRLSLKAIDQFFFLLQLDLELRDLLNHLFHFVCYLIRGFLHDFVNVDLSADGLGIAAEK